MLSLILPEIKRREKRGGSIYAAYIGRGSEAVATLKQSVRRNLRQRKKEPVLLPFTEEKAEEVRTEYDYRSTQEALGSLEEKIRRVKHAINKFNATQEVPGFGMTIDQLLIYLPQLTAKKNKLTTMAAHLPKERQGSYSRSGGNSIIECEHINYDRAQVKADKAEVEEKLIAAQTALDKLNNSVRFEGGIDF